MSNGSEPPADRSVDELLQEVPRWCKFVRLLWCDAAGVRRCKVVPASRLPDAAKQGVGLTAACMALGAHEDAPAPGAGIDADGETRIVPDLNVFRQVPWREKDYISLVDMRTSSGEPWPYCPREALRRALSALQSEFGITMQIGSEVEFYLMREQPKPGEPPQPLEDSCYCQSSAYDAAADDLEAIVSAVQRLSRAEVSLLHGESGNGQYELVLRHTDASAAADMLVLAREALVATAARRGHPASLLPKPFDGQCASGAHLHFSLHKDGSNLMTGGPAEAHGLREQGEHFLSGVLGHLPGALPFLAASTNSYRRLAPSAWAGAYQVWGVNHREAALRLIAHEDEEVANCELKTMDGTANPYIAIAAVVTAGLLGLRRGGKLPHPISVDPASLTREERQRDGIRRLPTSLIAALDTLGIDKDLEAGLKDTLGDPLLKAYIAVKRCEAEHFKEASLEEERSALWQRY